MRCSAKDNLSIRATRAYGGNHPIYKPLIIDLLLLGDCAVRLSYDLDRFQEHLSLMTCDNGNDQPPSITLHTVDGTMLTTPLTNRCTGKMRRNIALSWAHSM